MDKWADYGISAVRYNAEQTHILRVKVHEDKGDTIGIAVEQTRSEVVSAIERGESFVTILRGADNKWEKGQDVHIITVNGVKYIRTDQNRRASDNLENLPEF
jgi:molybdopterin biosynthesis enzyme